MFINYEKIKMLSAQNIKFFNSKVSIRLRNSKRIKRLVAKIFEREKCKIRSISVVFCSDNELLVLNKAYLGHDYYTDVITFLLSKPNEEIIGEIYISVDRVKENAKTEKVRVESEIYRVIIHGVLHLCGYKDKSQKDKSLMRNMEDFYLDKLI